MNYRRWLSPKPLKLLLPQSQLGFVLNESRTWIGDDSNAIDLQLRDDNRLMVYYGQWCIVRLRIHRSGKRFEVRMPSKCSRDSIQVPYDWDLSRVPQLKKNLSDWVKAAADWCDKNRPNPYVNRTSRSYFLNQLLSEYGRRLRNRDHWILLDRIGIVHAKSKDDRDAKNQIIQKYAKLMEQYAGSRRNVVDGSLKPRIVSDTCDMLGANQKSELLTINVLDGESSNQRLVETLIHTACSREVFATNLKDLEGDLRKLWKQKVELGLLPRETEELSDNPFIGAKGTLFIVNPPLDLDRQIADLQTMMQDHPNLRMPVVFWRNREAFTVVEPECN